MSTNHTRVKYTGATPGADSNDYTLIDTRAMHEDLVAAAGLSWLIVDIAHDQDGTLKLYKDDGAGGWTLVTSAAITAPASGTTRRDFNIEPYRGVKLDWTNGGIAQGTWVVDIALVGEDRGAAT